MNDDVSACGACGRIIRGTEPGTVRFCPHNLRNRPTRELTEEEVANLGDYESADPAGRSA